MHFSVHSTHLSQKLFSNLAQANKTSEKEKIDNHGFIALKCWAQSSNHVVKRAHPPPPPLVELIQEKLIMYFKRFDEILWTVQKFLKNL